MKCRTCLRRTKNTLRIANEQQRLIELHLSIKVSPLNDAISTEICKRCWKQTKEFHSFFVLVRNAQDQLVLDKQPEEIQVKQEPYNDDNDDGDCDGDGDEIVTTELVEIQYAPTDVHPLYEPQINNNDEILQNITKDETTTTTFDTLSDFTKAPKIIDVEIPLKITKTRKRQYMDVENDDKVILEKRLIIANPKVIETPEAPDDNIDFITKTEDTVSDKEDISSHNEEMDYGNGSDNESSMASEKKPLKPVKKHKKHANFDVSDDELIKKYIRLVCDPCTFAAENYTELKKHFNRKHQDDLRSGYVICCRRKLRKRYELVQHAYKHEDPECFKCKECNKVFSEPRTLDTHFAYAHAPDKLKYACDQCDKRFDRPSALTLHKSYHVPEKDREFVCTQCPEKKFFPSEHQLQVHCKMCHNRSANVCHVCAKVIRDNKCFEKHVLTHFGKRGPKVKCPMPGCESWLQDADSLKEHLRRQHVNADQAVECGICQKVFKSKRLLRIHNKSNHDEARYSCSRCMKTFKRAIALKEHVAQHTGEKLYNCKYCTRTFNSSANMYAHRKKSHPEEWEKSRKSRLGIPDDAKNELESLLNDEPPNAYLQV